jgi:hypothetical protein
VGDQTVSFDIFVQRVEDGKAAPFKRAILAEILGPYASVGKNGEIYGAEFPDGDHPQIFGAEEEDIDGLCFNHGGATALQLIWDIADRTQSFIFWSDESPNLAVTSDAALAKTPQDIIDDLGPAKIVRNGQELGDYIARPR